METLQLHCRGNQLRKQFSSDWLSGIDPSAPLKNPRWRLLEAPAGSALAAGLPSFPVPRRLPDRAPAVRASNGAHF